MRVGFRQQVSDYDCVPATFVNALCYLFHRQEIPPFVISRIYKECLDKEASRGTSGRAIRDLSHWLNSYQDKGYKRFAVTTKYLSGRQVHLKDDSRIIRCINSQGVALLNVHTCDNAWHYILCFRYEEGWLHCYDPHPRSNRFIKDEAVQFLDATEHHAPNLMIRIDWLDKNFSKAKRLNDRKYVLGHKDDRECLLLNRIEA
jgi:hypothetical protein